MGEGDPGRDPRGPRADLPPWRDRQDLGARPGEADGRRKGKNARRAAGGHHDGDAAEAQREGPGGGARRGAAEAAVRVPRARRGRGADRYRRVAEGRAEGGLGVATSATGEAAFAARFTGFAGMGMRASISSSSRRFASRLVDTFFLSDT